MKRRRKITNSGHKRLGIAVTVTSSGLLIWVLSSSLLGGNGALLPMDSGFLPGVVLEVLTELVWLSLPS